MQVIPFAKCVAVCVVAFSAITSSPSQDNDALKAKIKLTREFLINQRAAPAYRDSIQKSILAYEAGLDIRCKEVVVDFASADVRDRILALVEVDDKGVAIAGAWRETLPGTACNEHRRFTVQVEVAGQGLRFTATFPGEADGDPELQRDTLKNIEMDLQILRFVTKKSCHAEVIDSHLVGERSTLQDNGLLSQWKESWDVRSCGKVYAVPITYIPDKSGTAISVGVSDIHAE